MNAHLTTLGIGAVVVALQLYLVRRSDRTGPGAAATACLGILICLVLLETGHQAQRARPARHESLESLLLHDRAAAVSYEPRQGWTLITGVEQAPSDLPLR
ncbi:hypothetical protein M1L60_07915 [Actinoplanes sp. TRM 88003]|uniref:Uncharacterized protein n=1 Tax=Paractinoplanes aksuensis TaxID=2939490 RepID=A0ABT1DL90_9ACTN|nr:hypothetical protein [Actinoplanes aksuensis]MCO8270521.1 hypothetical protein [Actinoplanes aksuensis]